MANLWVSNGSSCITSATLGNLLDKRVEVSHPVYFEVNASSSGYIYSQAASTSGQREFGPHFISGRLDVFAGGSTTAVGNIVDIFPSVTSGVLKTITDYNAATFDILLDGVSLIGGPIAITVGTNRADGCLFRFGARAGSTPGDNATSNSFILSANQKIGDTTVEIYNSSNALVLSRIYQMPSSGVIVTETIGGNDGTLRGGTGDGSDWEVLSSGISAPEAGNGLIAAALGATTANRSFSGLHDTGLSLTYFEYRIFRGVTEIQPWSPVESFTSSAYVVSDDWPLGELTVELRAGDGVTEFTQSFDIAVGYGVALIGSSSGERMVENGTGTLNAGNILYVQDADENITRYDNSSGAIAGQSMVQLVNDIAETDVPIFILAYASSGSIMQVAWMPTSITYNNFVNETVGSVSTVIDQVGYNDAAGGRIVTQAEIQSRYDEMRIDFGAIPIITGTAQRNTNYPTRSDEFYALWRAYAGVIAANDFVYPAYRHDLEISGDDIHLTAADSVVAAQRFAQVINFLSGKESYYKGPSISSVSYNGTDVSINLSQAGTSYSSINPSTGIAGFVFYDDGVEIGHSNVSSPSAGRITATLSSEPTGDLTVLFGGILGYDTSRTFSNYPIANSSIPMPVDPIYTAIVASEQTSSGLINTGLSLGISIGI